MKRPTKAKKPQAKKPKSKPKATAISFTQPPNAGKRSILNTPLFR